MSWESRRGGGRYYTRSRRVNGRIEREYVGTGPVAELIAGIDALDRADRVEVRADERRFLLDLAAFDAEIDLMDRWAEQLTRVHLLATGHHRHHGGEWRKRRG